MRVRLTNGWSRLRFFRGLLPELPTVSVGALLAIHVIIDMRPLFKALALSTLLTSAPALATRGGPQARSETRRVPGVVTAVRAAARSFAGGFRVLFIGDGKASKAKRPQPDGQGAVRPEDAAIIPIVIETERLF
jgi:hypothetical protein